MKVFVDANVLIATLNKEYPLFPWSSRLLSLQGENGIKILTSPLSLAIAYNFSRKKSGEERAAKKTELLGRTINVVSMDEKATRRAINAIRDNDFIDALEYYSAIYAGCDYFVTESRINFVPHQIKIIGCEELLKKL